MSQQVLPRWFPSCAASRSAADHYLLLLPFVALSGDEPPAAAVAALMVLAAAAMLWARGWGDAAFERAFVFGWALAWAGSLTALGAVLGAAARPSALASLVATLVVGLWGLARARRARGRLVARARATGTPRNSLFAAGVLFAALAGAETIRRVAGAPPPTGAFVAAMALAAVLLFALARRGRVASSEATP